PMNDRLGGEPRSSLLVTGATGFLAQHLIPELLKQRPDASIHLLVRDASDSRIAPFLGRDRRRLERVRVVTGDVSRPDLGLGSASDRFAGSVTEVFHLAALTQLDAPIEVARRANVGGTRNVLALCQRAAGQGRFDRLHYLSTAYVSGTRQGTIRESDLDCNQGFENTYERSKFEAEAEVMSVQKNISVTIYRPSIIVGESKSGRSCNFGGAFYQVVRLIAVGALRTLLCAPKTKVDIVPVDFVSAAVCRLSQDPRAVGRTFHITIGD